MVKFFKYIDEDNTPQQCLDISNNIELSNKCGINTKENNVIVNNVYIEKDSAREGQRENITVESSTSKYNLGEEQIVLLNAGQETVTIEQTSEQHVTKKLLCYDRVLRSITNFTKEQADGFSMLSRVQIYYTLIISIIFNVLDMGTDVWLMCKYFLSGQYLYGTLTMVFVWVPAFINTYRLYEICIKNINTRLYQQFTKNKCLLIILYILPISSVVVAFNNLILFWKHKMDKKDGQEKTVHLLRLQMADSYLEALPQLTLQLSIILNNVKMETQDTSFLNMLRWCSMAMSAFTVARVTYSHATRYIDNIGVKLSVTSFISTLFLVVSRVFVMSMGFAVSPTVTGVWLLLHWCVQAVADYCKDRKEQQTVFGVILDSAIDATMCIFYYSWYYLNRIICWKLSLRTFTFTMYTLECVLFTILWCVLESNTHGTVWYYVVPAVPVLLYILCVLLVWLQGYFRKKRRAARQLQRTNQA